MKIETAIPRLFLGIGLNFALLVLIYPPLLRWSGFERLYFTMVLGLVCSATALFVLAPVAFRGGRWQQVTAVLLGIFPAVTLVQGVLAITMHGRGGGL